jgi:hypothetical protein
MSTEAFQSDRAAYLGIELPVQVSKLLDLLELLTMLFFRAVSGCSGYVVLSD